MSTNGRKLKTGYGEGSITVLREATSSRPGKYQIRTGRPGIDQKTRSVECANDTAAKTLARSIDLLRRDAAPSPDGPRTVCDLIDAWVKWGGGATPWSSSTVASRSERCRIVCRSDIGTVRLVDLTRKMVEDQIATWGLTRAPGGVTTLYKSLASAMSYGQKNGWAGCSVERLTRGTAPRKNPNDKVIAIPTDDLRQIVKSATATGGRVELLVRLIAATGCRIGEILGLTWDRVDLEAGTVTIDRQRSQDDERYGTERFSPTKNRKVRTLQLDPSTIALLASRQGASSEASDKVVGYVRQANARTAFKALEGTSAYHPHQVRHTVASAMLLAGYSVVEVARQLGDTPAVVLDTYAHYLPAEPPAVGSLLADLAGI